MKIDGLSVEVQIKETLLIKVKYNQSSGFFPKKWFFGGIEIGSTTA